MILDHVTMVGTKSCTVCKELHPLVEDYCLRNGLIFRYVYLEDKDLRNHEEKSLKENIKRVGNKAPVIMIFDVSDELFDIFSGEDSFDKMKSRLGQGLQVHMSDMI